MVNVSCSTADTEEETVKTEDPETNTFITYIDQIPDLQLPVTFDCGVFMESVEIDRIAYEEYIPEEARIVAKVEHEDKVLIWYEFAYDISYPMFFVHDQNGESLDTLTLYNGTCTGDPWLDSSCRTTIDEDLNIVMEDTLRHFFFNDTIRYLDSIQLITEKYHFGKSGEFSLISESIVRIE